MVFYFVLFAIVFFSLIMGAREVDKHRREKSKPMRLFIEGLGEFGAALLVSTLIGFFVFGLFSVGARMGSGPDRVEIVSSEMYNIAPDSKFTTTDDEISFTFVHSDGTLEAKHAEFDYLELSKASNSVLVVTEEKHYREWLVPWAMETKVTASFH